MPLSKDSSTTPSLSEIWFNFRNISYSAPRDGFCCSSATSCGPRCTRISFAERS